MKKSLVIFASLNAVASGLTGFENQVSCVNQQEFVDLVETDIYQAMIDLFEILSDAAIVATVIYRLRLNLFLAEEEKNPTLRERRRAQQVLNTVTKNVINLIEDDNMYQADYENLKNDIAQLRACNPGSYDDDYKKILELGAEAQQEMQKALIDMQGSMQTLGLARDFGDVQEELSVLEAALYEFIDAVSNKIFSLRLTIAESGQENLIPGKLPFIESLGVNVRNRVGIAGLYNNEGLYNWELGSIHWSLNIIFLRTMKMMFKNFELKNYKFIILIYQRKENMIWVWLQHKSRDAWVGSG